MPPVPFVTTSPAISFPLLVIMPLASFFLAKAYVKKTTEKRNEGLKFGLTIILINIIMDLLVIVWLFGRGPVYFASLTVWLGYAAVGAVPYLAGRARVRQTSIKGRSFIHADEMRLSGKGPAHKVCGRLEIVHPWMP